MFAAETTKCALESETAEYTYKMFCSSLEEVDRFACICFSACLLEYLVP